MKKLLFLLTALISSSSFAQTGWNFNDWNTQTYTDESTTENGLTVKGTDTAVEDLSSSRTVNVNGNNITFSKYLKLPGAPSSSTRFVQFEVTGPCQITVVYSHSTTAEGTKKRLVNIHYGAEIEKNSLHSMVVEVSSKTTAQQSTVNYELNEANTIYISSGAGTVYVWGIYITPYTPDDTKALSENKEWDFTSALTSDDKTNIDSDSDWSITEGTPNKYSFMTTGTDANTTVGNFPGKAMIANSSNVSITEGLLFGRKNGKLDASRFVINEGRFLNIVGKGPGMVIQGLKRNDIIKVRFSTASNGSNRSLVLSNATSQDDLSSSDANNPKEVTLTVLSDGYVELTGSEGLRYYSIEINPSANIDISIEDTGYATFSAYERFVVPSGLTAYRAVYNDATSSVSLSEITDGIIPSSTGVILKGTPNTPYTLTSTTSAVTTGDNNMKANVKAKTMTETETIDEVEYTNFILVSDGDGGVKFAKVSGGTLGANKSYLQLPTDDVTARELSISFDDGETTGIVNAKLNANLNVNESFYNLAGQRVAQPTKGLYIVNGKKYIVK